MEITGQMGVAYRCGRVHSVSPPTHKTLTVVWLLGSSRSGTGPGVGELFVSPSVVAALGPAGLGLGQVLVTCLLVHQLVASGPAGLGLGQVLVTCLLVHQWLLRVQQVWDWARCW